MTDYAADIKTFTPVIDEGAVSMISEYCGIAMRSAESSLVSATDPKELATVRDGFAARKLGLAADAADVGIKAVVEKMKATPKKNRVTFYDLLAEATGTLDKPHRAGPPRRG
ncbi:MAG: DUF2853 family protein [Burkholderiaceae bacterium]|nr:DUF2853 family protein [Burkholderiaceae bacterium]